MWFQTNIQDDAHIKPIRDSWLSATRLYPTFIPRWWSPPITRKGGLRASHIILFECCTFYMFIETRHLSFFGLSGGVCCPRLFVCSPCLVVLLASLNYFFSLWTGMPSLFMLVSSVAFPLRVSCQHRRSKVHVTNRSRCKWWPGFQNQTVYGLLPTAS